MGSSMPRPRAIVLLSGGLDSATALAIAKSEGYDCYTLGFDYGQRHARSDSAPQLHDSYRSVRRLRPD
jgi:7-cyano-7-deazaguanine synthase in queuosine biosynthesis